MGFVDMGLIGDYEDAHLCSGDGSDGHAGIITTE